MLIFALWFAKLEVCTLITFVALTFSNIDGRVALLGLDEVQCVSQESGIQCGRLRYLSHLFLMANTTLTYCAFFPFLSGSVRSYININRSRGNAA